MKNIIFLIFIVLSLPAFSAGPEIVLDVRTPSEFLEGHVEGAKNLDFYNSTFKAELERLDRNHTYKVYCRSGGRSEKAKLLMEKMGFKNVENLGSLTQALKKTNRRANSP